MDAMTTGDVAGSKPEPKLTNEKAAAVVGPKVDALLTEVLAGFELAADDKKSHKRILKAVAEACAKKLNGVAGLNPRNIERQFSYGVSRAFPPPPLPDFESDETEGESDE